LTLCSIISPFMVSSHSWSFELHSDPYGNWGIRLAKLNTTQNKTNAPTYTHTRPHSHQHTSTIIRHGIKAFLPSGFIHLLLFSVPQSALIHAYPSILNKLVHLLALLI
jgi:hypothetical protein